MHKILSFLYQLLNQFIFKSNSINVLKDPKFHGILFVRNSGSITIGEGFKASSGKRYNPIGGDSVLRIICRPRARIVIGNNVGISNSTLFISKELIVGDNVMIGGGCRIWDSDFHSLDPDERIYNGDKKAISKPIVIGNNAFIGASSIVLKGVTIGENCVIGAGSVVAKSIPKNEIWAGNPARKINSIQVYE